MRIKKTKDGYRLKQTINHHASYFFITLKEAIKLSERLDADFEHDAKVCEAEINNRRNQTKCDQLTKVDHVP